MQAIIIEPSPLARNIYHMLLGTIDGLESIKSFRDFSELDAGISSTSLLVIGMAALVGEGARQRVLLTDAPGWSNCPKLVLVSPGARKEHAAWKDLPGAVTLKRPFRSQTFRTLANQLLLGAEK